MRNLKNTAEKVLTTLHDCFCDAVRATFIERWGSFSTADKRTNKPRAFSFDGDHWDLHIPTGECTTIFYKNIKDMEKRIELCDPFIHEIKHPLFDTSINTSKSSYLWSSESHYEVAWEKDSLGEQLPMLIIWGYRTGLGQPATHFWYKIKKK